MDDYHIFTYLLNPKNVSKSITAIEQTKLFVFIRTHLSSDYDYMEVQSEFLNYRKMIERFDTPDL
jgi:hypothetical protein